MRKIFSVMLIVMMTTLPMAGCATLGNGGWNDNIPRLEADIFMFTKLATRISLNEANMSAKDVGTVEGYLVALRDLLSVPGQPNFAGARVLVSTHLPPKYKIYGLSIIDVLERYLTEENLNITEDQEAIVGLVSACIDGALEAVQEFND